MIELCHTVNGAEAMIPTLATKDPINNNEARRGVDIKTESKDRITFVMNYTGNSTHSQEANSAARSTMIQSSIFMRLAVW